jgi:dephospho-CoA kinase
MGQPVIIGLTGSIGMGKSTIAAMFRNLHVPVFDADAAVHRLQAPGGAALPAIAAAFPGVVVDGRLDRAALGRRVFGDAGARRRLEAIMHPLVARERDHFLHRHRGRPVVVLDLPLLFEAGLDRICDLVVVASAPAAVQRGRVLARPGMDRDRLARILQSQVPDREKRARADLVVETGRGRLVTWRTVRDLVASLRRGRVAGSPAIG